MINLIFGDCLEKMDDISDRSIDMICCDLPYGTTRLKWDSVIDIDLLFEQYERIIKLKGSIVLFGNQPFTSEVIFKKISLYKYSWIWIKPFPTGFLNANYRPMLSFEDIMIFSLSGAGAGSKKNSMYYYPQNLVRINKIKKNKKESRGQHIHNTINCGHKRIKESEKLNQYKLF
jgi:site-specific DNA-methyltransferase (adenine-specific)